MPSQLDFSHWPAASWMLGQNKTAAAVRQPLIAVTHCYTMLQPSMLLSWRKPGGQVNEAMSTRNTAAIQ